MPGLLATEQAHGNRTRKTTASETSRIAKEVSAVLAALLGADESVFNAVRQTLGTGVPGPFFALVSHLGDWALVWLALCILVLYLGRGDEDSHRTVVVTIAAILVSELATGLLKVTIARPRPAEVLQHVRTLVPPPSGHSFPSAHAMRSFAAAGVLASYSRLRRWRWALWAFAGLISLSRVVVGVHFPFDVLAGAVLGCLIAQLALSAGRFWRSTATDQSQGQGKSARKDSAGSETPRD